MKITKMHGLGNDFILTEEKCDDYAAAARDLCRRRLSVGADGRSWWPRPIRRRAYAHIQRGRERSGDVRQLRTLLCALRI
jgi:diaminopimelate epimerase